MRPKIVDAFEPDDGRDAGEAQNIAAKAPQGSGAARIRVFSAVEIGFQDAVASDARIHDGDPAAEAVMQAAGEDVGPAILAIQACAHTVGQQVAKGHDELCSGIGHHVDSIEKKHRRRAERECGLILEGA